MESFWLHLAEKPIIWCPLAQSFIGWVELKRGYSTGVYAPVFILSDYVFYVIIFCRYK